MAALAVAVAVALFIVILGISETSKAAPAYRYPDLKTLKPTDLQFDTVGGSQVLRFSNTVWNRGQGPLELRGKTVTTSTGDKTRVFQRIYDGSGNYTSKAVGVFAYHPSHNHFHFGDFARYELWTRAEYDRWVESGGSQGQAQRRGSKTTFCIMDTRKVRDLTGSPGSTVYSQCGRTLQGLSVGWGDTYGYHLPEQWIDLGTTRLADGRYVLRSVADPKNRLYESANKNNALRESDSANANKTFFTVNGTNITITG
jgi:lysyl oxidase